MLVTDGFRVKICDFGLSKVKELASTSSLTMSFAAGPKGTPAYMAPEIIERGKYSRASDMYAFGIMVRVCSSVSECTHYIFR